MGFALATPITDFQRQHRRNVETGCRGGTEGGEVTAEECCIASRYRVEPFLDQGGPASRAARRACGAGAPVPARPTGGKRSHGPAASRRDPEAAAPVRKVGPVLPAPAALRVGLTILVLVFHPVMPTQQAEHVAPHPDTPLPCRGQRKTRRRAREALRGARPCDPTRRSQGTPPPGVVTRLVSGVPTRARPVWVGLRPGRVKQR